MAKFITAQEAAALVKDGDTLAVEGFIVNMLPEVLCVALEERFLKTGKPVDLTLTYAAGQGDGNGACTDHLGHERLLKKIICGHINLAPKLRELTAKEKVATYIFPQGTMSHLFRDIAAGRIGTLTHVGLKTYVDPRLDGGRLNKIAQEELVKLVQIEGKELLLYKAFPIDICFLRGTTADEKGNVSMEKEGVTLGVTAIAQAVKNSGGKVIVQVERVVKEGMLHPKAVKIPHIYVDSIVVVPEEKNMPEISRDMIDVYSGEMRIPTGSIAPIPLDERKIIARRASMELVPDTVVNLGFGVPEAISSVVNEEKINSYMTLTVEAGAVGGMPEGGLKFGLSINSDCILDQPAQFDFYDGGGVDLAYLGLAECDEQGNINVSKMGERVVGPGGFINITQNSKKVFFCGTFTTKGLEVKADNGVLRIIKEGAVKKFLKKVGHITFSGEYASEVGQPVTYITERAVFELRRDGMHLTEVAPGIDINKDILAHMDFVPKMATAPKLMDLRIFKDAPMKLNEEGKR